MPPFSRLILTALLASCLYCAPGYGESYVVTTLRAAPGQLEVLLDHARGHRRNREGKVLLMRHSQGDHWDLMMLEPASGMAAPVTGFDSTADFQLSFMAESETSFQQLQGEAATAGLFHIEMFHALAGKYAALVDQRKRENQYLARTGQTANAIFVSSFGSDVDVFTIGFHKDMAALDAGPTVTAAAAEQVARETGFKNRADLGFFLRSLIGSHHDTLAVPVSD
ncbi:MAG: hypothetical protein ABJ308_11355 [Halieaceae bacterium]